MNESSTRARPLGVLRALIDALDRDILELLSRRMSLVREVAEYKRGHRRKIRDFARESEILSERKRRGLSFGLSEELIESLWRLILWASRDYQASLRAEVPLDNEPVVVAIIGGRGGMGRTMARLFGDLGHAVMVADLETDLSPQEAAAIADVVVISVPIARTEAVIREVGPHVRDTSLLMDVTSVKEGPVQAMLEASPASVIGTHPMFGPSVHSLQGQRIVLCRGRGESWERWLRSTLSARGLDITDATPEAHDRAMALVQVLTHFQTQVLGLTLARSGVPLDETLRFASPIYLMELYVVGRHFAQSADLYGGIEMGNVRSDEMTEAFRKAASEVAQVVAGHDTQAFSKVFDEVRAFLGQGFQREAVEQSSFLIDRLVERS